MRPIQLHSEINEVKSYVLPDDYENDILNDIRNHNIKQGYTFNDVQIDRWLRFNTREFWLNVGNPNVGKSFMMFYLLTLLAKTHGLKFLIYSQENDVNDIKQSIIQFWLKENLFGMNDIKFREGLILVSEHFKFVDPKKIFNYKELIEQAKMAGDSFDYHGFMIDPYNALKIDRTLSRDIGVGHEYHYEAASDLMNFSHNNVSLILNCHTITEVQRGIDGNHDTKVPLLSHVEGGGKFTAKADVGTVMHRQIFNKDSYDITQIHVQKIRNKRKGGKPTPWSCPIEMRLSNNGCYFNLLDTLDDKREQNLKAEKAPF